MLRRWMAATEEVSYPSTNAAGFVGRLSYSSPCPVGSRTWRKPSGGSKPTHNSPILDHVKGSGSTPFPPQPEHKRQVGTSGSAFSRRAPENWNIRPELQDWRLQPGSTKVKPAPSRSSTFSSRTITVRAQGVTKVYRGLWCRRSAKGVGSRTVIIGQAVSQLLINLAR